MPGFSDFGICSASFLVFMKLIQVNQEVFSKAGEAKSGQKAPLKQEKQSIGEHVPSSHFNKALCFVYWI